MMAPVVQFRRPLYEAKVFKAQTVSGEFVSSGTLCGHLDFVVGGRTYILSPDDALAIIAMLHNAREDVLAHSDPLHDPRLYWHKP